MNAVIVLIVGNQPLKSMENCSSPDVKITMGVSSTFSDYYDDRAVGAATATTAMAVQVFFRLIVGVACTCNA